MYDHESDNMELDREIPDESLTSQWKTVLEPKVLFPSLEVPGSESVSIDLKTSVGWRLMDLSNAVYDVACDAVDAEGEPDEVKLQLAKDIYDLFERSEGLIVDLLKK